MIFVSLGWPFLPASKRDNEEGINSMEILGGGDLPLWPAFTFTF